MQQLKSRRATIAGLLAVGALALAPSSTAFGAITCVNPAGNAAPGQQGQCNGQAQTNENPAGHAPPGQNK